MAILPIIGSKLWGQKVNSAITAVEAIANAALAVANAAIPASQKAAASGVATLDAGGKIPDGQIPSGIARDSEVTAAVVAETAARVADVDAEQAAREAAIAGLSATYVPFAGAAAYTYNADGTVATETVGGLVTTYTYNADLSVHTVTRNGVTLTYSYNADGTVSGVA